MRYILIASLLLAGCGNNDPGLAKSMDITKSQRAAIEERIKSFSVVSVLGATAVAAVPALPGETKYIACGGCHGAQGGGGIGPALAGQTVEYIVNRLNQYKTGQKVGSQSNLMWGQAAGLSQQDMADLAEYIVTF